MRVEACTQLAEYDCIVLCTLVRRVIVLKAVGEPKFPTATTSETDLRMNF